MPPLVSSKIPWIANKKIEMFSLYNTHKYLKVRVEWAHTNGWCGFPFPKSGKRRILKAIFDALVCFCWEFLKYCSLKKQVFLKWKPGSCESASCETASCVFVSCESASCEPNNFRIGSCESSNLRIVSCNSIKL